MMSSDVDMTFVGLDATRQLKFLEPQIEEIAASGEAGLTLASETLDWWDFKGQQWGVPHDPIAISLALRPELFQLSSLGSVEIEQGGELDGVSRFKPGKGSARIERTFTRDAVRNDIIESVIRGCKLPSG